MSQEKNSGSNVSKEWAQLLAISLDDWCKENGMIPKTVLRDELGIKEGVWKHITAGNSITNAGIYARIFKRTDLPEADPRTIPPRGIRTPRTGRITHKARAMTEEEWQTWLSDHPPGTSLHETKPPTKPPVAEGNRMKASPPTATGGRTREYRRVIQRRFDTMLEQVLSEVIPRHPDPQDHGSIDELIWALKRVFEQLGRMDVSVRTQFADAHGRTLAVILPYLEAYTLPDEKKREQALSLIFGFNSRGETDLRIGDVE